MNNYFKNSILLIGLSFSLLSCGGEDLDDLEVDASHSEVSTADLAYTDLLGKWNINMLVAGTPVDLNGDGTKNSNLLLETTCFDPMSITFFENGTYSSVNARLDFAAGAGNNEFECMDSSAAPHTGTWELEGTTLKLSLTVDGVIYPHNKDLTFNGDSFSFHVTRLESQQHFNDPGNTVVSGVNIVSSEYIRATQE